MHMSIPLQVPPEPPQQGWPLAPHAVHAPLTQVVTPDMQPAQVPQWVSVLGVTHAPPQAI